MNALILALVMLMQKPAPENLPPQEWFVLYKSIEKVAVSLQIMDVREEGLFFTKENFVRRMAMMQNRYSSLNDAPLIQDAARFPSFKVLTEMMGFHEEFCRTKGTNMEGREDEELSDLFIALSSLVNAQNQEFYISVRRSNLASARDAMGGEAYYSGAVVAVPLKYFKAIQK